VTIDTTGMRDWTLTFEAEMKMLLAKKSYLAMGLVWAQVKAGKHVILMYHVIEARKSCANKTKLHHHFPMHTIVYVRQIEAIENCKIQDVVN
jgi:hypothetical protein